MKKAGLKRLFALALILVLAFSLSAPAFAGSEEVDETGTPAPTDTPTVTETPATTDTPTATETPAITDTPTVTETPAITDTPTVTETPATTDTPEVTETPTTTDTPKVTETPAPTETPAADEVPAAVKTFLDAVAAIVIPEEINEETGPVLNGQIGTAQTAYDALNEEDLAREDVQAAVALMKKAMDALTGGTQLLREKALVVDGAAEEQEGQTYKTIQAAINYIDTQVDKNGWTILVEAGTYDRFTVLNGLNSLVVTAAKDATVIINVCNNSDAPAAVSGAYPDTAGVSIRSADNVVLMGLTFSIGAQSSPWYSAAVSNFSESGVRGNNVIVTGCAFQGPGSGIGVFINTGTTQFWVGDCSFTGLKEGISMYGDGTLMAGANVTGNSFTGCSFAIHGYYGGAGDAGEAGTLTFANNTVTGGDTYSKIVIQDQTNTGAIKADIRNNQLTNAIVGLVNLREAGETVSNVLDSNTFNANSFYVEAIEPGTIDFYTSYQAPTNGVGYWKLTGKEDFDVDWGKNPDGSTAKIEELVQDANAQNSHTLNITGIDADNLIKTFTWFKDGLYWVTGEQPQNPDVQPDNPAPDWAVSKSKTATNLDANFESQVTLGLPAASYKGNLDVAFVLDGSTSADKKDLAAQAAALLDELAAIQNLNVKASLTVFGGTVPLLENTELLNISSDAGSLASLKGKLTDPSYDKKEGRSGSNLQAGVEAANKILAGDSSVAAADKYMIILSDGGARMWYKNGEAMSQAYCYGGGSIWWNSNQDFVYRYGVEGSSTRPLRLFDEVWSDGQSGAYIGMYGMTEAEKEAATKDQVASWETVVNSDNYYSTYEAATYYAAGSIVSASQNSNVIFVSYPYYSGLYLEYTDSFKGWLAEKNYVTLYDSNAMGEANVFKAVKDVLVQVVDAGSQVVDVIGNVEGDYNFDFVNSIDKLTLTVGGTALSKTSLTASSVNETACYGFDGNDFVLHYFAKGQDGQSDECFVWDINVPVTKDEPVQLTYTVKLTNPKIVEGTYGQYDADGSKGYPDLYTNNSAILTPKDSNGNTGATQEFPKPTVSYTVKAAKQTVNVTKVWDDSNNADGLRPDSVTVTLLANGKETDKTLVLNAANKWTGSFKDLDAKDAAGKAITYTVAENKVEYYTTAITNDAGTLNFTITNSHEVVRISIPVQKVWNDDNDANGKRPNSVTIYLYANGEKVDTMRLSAKSGWKGSFENLPVFKDGKSISYSISEKSMYFYDGKVTVNENRDGFVVTNTYTTSPHTGDTSNIGLWVAVAVVCLVGIGAAVVIIKKKGSKK